MFSTLIDKIIEAVNLNIEATNSDSDDSLERSIFTAGMINGYSNILQSMGHNVEIHFKNDYFGETYVYTLKINKSYLVMDGDILNHNYKNFITN